ncbi:MAG: TonB-dependent receptor, partial [Sphingobacteriales bacterium]
MKKCYTNFLLGLSYVSKLCNLSAALVAIVLLLMSTTAFSQTIQITGTVKDDNGGTIPGVGVRVKDATISAQTDNNGKFTIAVPNAQSVLVFSYIGMEPYETTVGNRTTIEVTLKESQSELDEVIVTGYGERVRKRDITGSISSVSAKDIEERQPLNLFDALQGKAAGVLVVNDNGEPGAEGSITIRGPSTFSSDGNGTSPLYVIDGVITPNAAAINPNDIESVEVLKDAASASIYGSRAANGVILITTKRGVEGKPRLDVQYVYTLGEISHRIQQSNSADIRRYRQMQGQLNVLTDSLNPGLNSANDLQDLLLGNTAKKHDVK